MVVEFRVASSDRDVIQLEKVMGENSIYNLKKPNQTKTNLQNLVINLRIDSWDKNS